MIFPSGPVMTAPTGTSPRAAAESASSSAAFMGSDNGDFMIHSKREVDYKFKFKLQ
jgi:hypothetical protein